AVRVRERIRRYGPARPGDRGSQPEPRRRTGPYGRHGDRATAGRLNRLRGDLRIPDLVRPAGAYPVPGLPLDRYPAGGDLLLRAATGRPHSRRSVDDHRGHQRGTAGGPAAIRRAEPPAVLTWAPVDRGRGRGPLNLAQPAWVTLPRTTPWRGLRVNPRPEQHVGIKLREARERAGMTQAEVA